VPELPAAQKDALHALVKAPLVYTNVALRNWTAIHKLGARRVLLTHMGREMLANLEHVRDPRVMLAEDGMRIDI